MSNYSDHTKDNLIREFDIRFKKIEDNLWSALFRGERVTLSFSDNYEIIIDKNEKISFDGRKNFIVYNRISKELTNTK